MPRVEYDLTEKEFMHLRAAVCDYFHNMKSKFDDETYGPLITDERVLCARELWRKIERDLDD